MRNFNFDYLITGGYAVYLYTGNRKFNDIDLVVRESDMFSIAKELGEDIKTSLSEFGSSYTYILHDMYDIGTFQIEKDSNLYDLGYEACLKKARMVNYKGSVMNVVSPEDLIALKLVFLRQGNGKQDVEDIRTLIKHIPLDLGYLVKRVREVGMIEILDRIANQINAEDIQDIIQVESRCRYYIKNSRYFTV